MQTLECKIKKILAVNELGLNDQFIEFFKTEQHLQQLSKLVYELKKQSTMQPLLTEILEPAYFENKKNSHENEEEIQQVQLDLDKSQTLHTENSELNLENNTVTSRVNSQPQKHDISDQIPDILENSLSSVSVQEDNLVQKIQSTTQDTFPSSKQENITVASISEPMIMVEEILPDPEPQNIEQHAQEQQAKIDQNRVEITDVFTQRKVNDLKFQVDNARAGQPYISNIQILSNQEIENVEYIAESFKFPNEIFHFDQTTQNIHGEPNQADEFNFSFQYRVNGEVYTGQCRLNVIPDPRSLWKVIEPEAG